MRQVIGIGAGAAAAARLARRAYEARRRSPSAPNGLLIIRPTIEPELVADLTDMLRRVTGRAASDEAGGITVRLAPGVEPSEVERELRAVVDRWSEMHPGIRVQVAPSAESPHLARRRKLRRRVEAEESLTLTRTSG